MSHEVLASIYIYPGLFSQISLLKNIYITKNGIKKNPGTKARFEKVIKDLYLTRIFLLFIIISLCERHILTFGSHRQSNSSYRENQIIAKPSLIDVWHFAELHS